MQKGPFFLIWRKQELETISLIIFKHFRMVDGINNDISASCLFNGSINHDLMKSNNSSPTWCPLNKSLTANCPTNTAGYCGLRLAFGIFLLSLFRRFEGSESTFTLELATVNAQTISDVSGLTKQYDFQATDWHSQHSLGWRTLLCPHPYKWSLCIAARLPLSVP